MKKQTKAIHHAYQRRDPYGALGMPVYNAVAYEFENADEMADSFCGRSDLPDYSRVTNPTVIYFENKVKELTGARDVVAVNSGMAAIANALMAVAGAGKKIVTSTHLFGNTYMLLVNTLSRFGVRTEFCDLTNPAEVEKALDDDTCCLFLEIMTNPQMEVADIRRLADIAHAKGVPVMADTTMIPFTCFEAKGLGIDVEVVSSTKYISGGATSIGGLIIDYGTIADFQRCMRKEMLLNMGAYMTPQVAYMMTLGLENLAARYAMQHANAMEVARRLSKVPGITVNYPGLEDNPYHAACRDQFGGTFGAMITFDLASEEECYRFINALKLVKRATNLFDNRTLAIHPASTIFGPLTPEQREAMDISPRLIRLSVGLEDVDDIMEDLVQAIETAQKSK